MARKSKILGPVPLGPRTRRGQRAWDKQIGATLREHIQRGMGDEPVDLWPGVSKELGLVDPREWSVTQGVTEAKDWHHGGQYLCPHHAAQYEKGGPSGVVVARARPPAKGESPRVCVGCKTEERHGDRNIEQAPGLRPRARCDVSCKTCVHYLAKGHTGKGYCQLYDFMTYKKWVCDSWKGQGIYAKGERNRHRSGRRSTKRPFTQWRLGGNIVAQGYVRPSDGASVVWFPENMSLEGDPVVAVFEATDVEWTNPILWEPAATLSEANAILDRVDANGD